MARLQGGAILTALVAVLLGGLISAGCGTPARIGPVDDPGRGTSIADAAYRAVNPKAGEQAMAPNPPLEPHGRYLSDRFLDACDQHPEWRAAGLVDDREDTTSTIYFATAFWDHSAIVFIETRAPGPHGDPPAEDAGTLLRGVEVYRPKQ